MPKPPKRATKAKPGERAKAPPQTELAAGEPAQAATALSDAGGVEVPSDPGQGGVADRPPEIAMLALNVDLVDLEGCYPYANNTRVHPPEQKDAQEAAMRAYGWTMPMLLRSRTDLGIIAGHLRWEIGMDRLGLKQGPAIFADGWSEEQIRAYVIWDNKSAEMAGWDVPLLTLELGSLRDAGFDLALTGFSLGDLHLMEAQARPGVADPDAPAPPEPAVAVTQLGDIWVLGDHRIICGDSTQGAVVGALLDGVKPKLMATDPPYGVEYDPNWRNSAERSTKIKGRKIGATALGKVENDGRADWKEAWDLFPGDVAYVWHAGLHAGTVAVSLQAAGFAIRSQIIWNKEVHIIGRGDYHWKHEPCWYAVRVGATGHFNRDLPDGRKQNTVWDIQHRASETGHSTQKPVECMARPIRNNTEPGDAVYEPFSGSGTTIIAGEVTGRQVYAIELKPAYVDVAVRRWETYTGKTATLLATGQTFAEIQAERVDKSLEVAAT